MSEPFQPPRTSPGGSIRGFTIGRRGQALHVRGLRNPSDNREFRCPSAMRAEYRQSETRAVTDGSDSPAVAQQRMEAAGPLCRACAEALRLAANTRSTIEVPEPTADPSQEREPSAHPFCAPDQLREVPEEPRRK
jgi:hypothetical protein